jgi:uncharacterized membrane protein YkvA (DUF1232 family)
VLILLARRLPPGPMRDLAAFLPDSVTAARRLRTDPRVPRRAKVAMMIAGLWVLSPIDLIPEFLPVIGPLDDVIVAILVLRFVRRRLGDASLRTRWKGTPGGFELLVSVLS